MTRHRRIRGFTLPESLLALFLVGLAMGFLGLLFQKSFNILRVLDDKERARQAGRMGYDRLSSELREATELLRLNEVAEFRKINPQARMVDPPEAPIDPPASWSSPPAWTPLDAYPESVRMTVLYTTSDEALYRTVTAAGQMTRQLIVEGVNSFVCTSNPDNLGEVEIVLSVKEDKRVSTVSGRILCPCIKEEFR